MTYYIGQRLDPVEVAPAQSGPMDPAWFGFLTAPRKERSAAAWLERRGIDAWFPTETRWLVRPKARVRRIAVEMPVIGRYVFGRFTEQPQWHVIRDCRWITRVVGVEDRPLAVPDEVMGQMAQVPGRLEAIRRRRAERRKVSPGDRVRINAGPLSGWVVEVSEVHAGVAHFLIPLLGERRATARTQDLDKLLPPASIGGREGQADD